MGQSNSLPESSQAEPPQVVVYGTVCLDQYADFATASLLQEVPGGEAFNTATALHGWQVRVLLTGTALGNDSESDRLRVLLDDPDGGLPRTYISDIPNAVTPVCTVRVGPDGERQMSGRGFQQAQPSAPLPDTVYQSHPILAIDGNLGQAAVDEVQRAHQHGCRVVAMDFPHPTIEAVAPHCHILLSSQEWLTRDRKQAVDPETVVRDWVSRGAAIAVLTLGRAGAFAFSQQTGLLHVPACPITAVDTTGAGDTFRAGICYGLLQGASLQGALEFASAAAALHCKVWGSNSRILLPEVLNFSQSRY